MAISIMAYVDASALLTDYMSGLEVTFGLLKI